MFFWGVLVYGERGKSSNCFDSIPLTYTSGYDSDLSNYCAEIIVPFSSKPWLDECDNVENTSKLGGGNY